MPKHISIIADGNCRWANERNLPVIDGYKKALENIFSLPKYFFEKGVEIVSVFIFPQENWQRDQAEINELMKLVDFAFKSEMDNLKEKSWKVLISGQINELPGDLEETCHKIMNETKLSTKRILNLYINYDGRQELLNVMKKLVSNNIEAEQIHEGLVRKYLYHGGISDPELVIVSGGEKKLLGFQLWQTANSEIIFMNKYWPDFEELDIKNILNN